VDLLIGVENADLHYSFFLVRCQMGEPVARVGPLGWTEVRNENSHHWREAEQGCGVGVCCELDHKLKRLWEVESCGTEARDLTVCAEEEQLALQKVSFVHYNNGRYRIAVPCKEQSLQLPNNLEMAELRLCSTERNRKKSEFVEKRY